MKLNYNNFDKYNNFNPTNIHEKVKELSVNVVLSEYDKCILSEYDIKQKIVDELSYLLADEIVKNNYITSETYTEAVTLNEIFAVKTKICKNSTSYVNFVDNVFRVDKEEITNDELVQAVRNTFPERFI